MLSSICHPNAYLQQVVPMVLWPLLGLTEATLEPLFIDWNRARNFLSVTP